MRCDVMHQVVYVNKTRATQLQLSPADFFQHCVSLTQSKLMTLPYKAKKVRKIMPSYAIPM